MTRRLRPAIEIVSNIGSLGFDLQHHSAAQITEAVTILRSVNPGLFSWLVRQLNSGVEDPVSASPAGGEKK